MTTTESNQATTTGSSGGATARTALRTEPNPKRVRGIVGDRTVVDSTRSRYVWENPYWPAWFFPVDDVDAELRPRDHTERRRGERRGVVHHDVVVDGEIHPAAARSYPESDDTELASLVAFDWSLADRWLEEDVEMIVHPRSPYVRVDVLPSSRHVVVRVDGAVVADTTRPTLLFETGLPTRYYLPPEDVRLDLLEPTDSQTSCPYKGHARYWSVRVGDTRHEDLAWGYDAPLPESAGVEGLVAFYNERVEIEVDGVVEAQPRTKFS